MKLVINALIMNNRNASIARITTIANIAFPILFMIVLALYQYKYRIELLSKQLI